MYSKSFAKSLNYRLRELELIINYIETVPEPSRIDIDLALDKTRELYDMLLKIDSSRLEENDSVKPGTVRHVVPPDPDPVQDEKPYDTESILPDPVHKQMEVRTEDQDMNKTPGPVQAGIADETRGNSRKADQPDMKSTQDEDGKDAHSDKKKNGSSDIEIVADRYQSSQNYINQAMADKQVRKDLTSRIQSRPISDLRNSIGLNEKFLFIKELFKGRPEKYNQCIDTLNQTTTLEEALKYLQENFSWSSENEVAEKLINLLKRKHQPE